MKQNDTDLLFVAVNASYIHTNPAVRELAYLCGARWKEYNINQQPAEVLRDLYAYRPDMVGFSCYIWNIGYVLRLAQDLKKLLPGITVVLGGPEVSYDAGEVLRQNPFVDAVVCGEAEHVLPVWLGAGGDVAPPKGVFTRKHDDIAGVEHFNTVTDWFQNPAMFQNDTYDDTKIYYYESSRGCMFSCRYCLAGVGGGALREKPVQQVLDEMRQMEAMGIHLVKFTDRTFNANLPRAKEIFSYLATGDSSTCYHFEVALDLLDEEAIRILGSIPPGRVQLEAGVQSCNERTLRAVARKTNLAQLRQNAAAILAADNIHLHMDLIAGLPYEDMSSFERSFNRVYALYPHYLQLGFLKLLKGATLRRYAAEHGIVYRTYPPYEVLYTSDISADDLFLLKGMEELLNRYYNTGRARRALDFVTKNGYAEPFEFYRGLHAYCARHGYTQRPVGARQQFEILIDYGETFLDLEAYNLFLQQLDADYTAARIKGRRPAQFSAQAHS